MNHAHMLAGMLHNLQLLSLTILLDAVDIPEENGLCHLFFLIHNAQLLDYLFADYHLGAE